MSKITENHRNDDNFERFPDGRNKLKKGNTIGRMHKRGFTLTDLNKLIRQYEETHDLPILRHYIGQLFKDNTLLGKYIDKNVPTKTINELTGKDGTPLTVTLRKVTYEP